MAKPQVITFPFLLLLWDYWPLGRIAFPDKVGSAARGERAFESIRGLALEKVPLLLLSAASAVVTMQAQQAGGAVRTLTRYGLPVRLETAVISYVRYLGEAFWPAKLVAMYPHSSQLYPAWQVGAAALELLLISAAVVLRARQQRYLAVGWFWFLGTLVPMIGLVQVGEQSMADRYAYISFIGLFVMIVWLIADLASAHRISKRWLAVPAVVCILLLGILANRQVHYWHDTESFWIRTIALTKNNYVAHGEFAAMLHEQGRTEEAMEQIRAVLAIHPDDAPANLVLAEYERSQGNLATAIERYQIVALRSANAGTRARAFTSLGYAYRQMGESTKARQAFETSLQLSPGQPAVMVALGVIKEREGDLSAAVQQYSHAMALQTRPSIGLPASLEIFRKHSCKPSRFSPGSECAPGGRWWLAGYWLYRRSVIAGRFRKNESARDSLSHRALV